MMLPAFRDGSVRRARPAPFLYCSSVRGKGARWAAAMMMGLRREFQYACWIAGEASDRTTLPMDMKKLQHNNKNKASATGSHS